MRRALVLSLVILACGTGAKAQSQGKPHRRPPPAPAAALATPPSPLAPARLMRGVSAFLPDAGPTCRAQCSKARYSCHGEDDATDCDGRWLTCLSLCGPR